MKNLHKWGAWMGAGAVMLTLAGCADRNKNGVPDDAATSGEVSKTVDNAGDKMEAGAEKAVDATGKAVDKAGNAIENTADKAGALALTPKIKTALGAESALKGSSIDVDTDAPNKTVHLKGTVTSNAQKTLAGSVAKKNATDFKIDNALTVSK